MLPPAPPRFSMTICWPSVLHLFGGGARHQIVAAAGSVGDDQGDGTARVILREAGLCGEPGDQGQQNAARLEGHSDVPHSSLTPHSALIPTAFTRSDHIVSSRSMMAAYSCGVVGCGSAPSTRSRSRTSSLASAALSARLSLSITVRGVPAGAATPQRSGTS